MIDLKKAFHVCWNCRFFKTVLGGEPECHHPKLQDMNPTEFPSHHCEYKLLNTHGHIEDDRARTHYKITEGDKGLGYDS